MGQMKTAFQYPRVRVAVRKGNLLIFIEHLLCARHCLIKSVEQPDAMGVIILVSQVRKVRLSVNDTAHNRPPQPQSPLVHTFITPHHADWFMCLFSLLSCELLEG